MICQQIQSAVEAQQCSQIQTARTAKRRGITLDLTRFAVRTGRKNQQEERCKHRGIEPGNE